jgi:hypothetical protein
MKDISPLKNAYDLWYMTLAAPFLASALTDDSEVFFQADYLLEEAGVVSFGDIYGFISPVGDPLSLWSPTEFTQMVSKYEKFWKDLDIWIKDLNKEITRYNDISPVLSLSIKKEKSSLVTEFVLSGHTHSGDPLYTQNIKDVLESLLP